MSYIGLEGRISEEGDAPVDQRFHNFFLLCFGRVNVESEFADLRESFDQPCRDGIAWMAWMQPVLGSPPREATEIQGAQASMPCELGGEAAASQSLPVSRAAHPCLNP
jgi:hypothetical protein